MSEEDRIVNEILEKNGRIKLARKVYELENIIKEVREKVNTLYNNFMYDEDYRYDEDGDSILEIKQILDKENK